ncbi:MAG: FHA domain-containing protein [Rhodocyclales bacterium]|nr:FHA domain-containing protein [Rhodocyclales bacterium]
MISCRLIQITRNRQGQPIRTERRIAGDALRIGRGAECAIHLPDHSVKLRHAVIRDTDAGTYYIEGDGTPVCVNGSFHEAAELVAGTRISIGPYELVAETAAGGAELVVSIELVRPHPQEENLLARAPVSLAATGLSKRQPAFWLGLLIALAFLLLPLVQTNSPSVRQALAALPLTPLQTWNPGPLLPGHQSFAAQCDKCHRQAFRAVPDAACTDCHRATSPHATPAAAADLRCAGCHRDHKGKDGMVRSDVPLCVSCHGDIKRRSVDSALADVHGFDADHPEFSVTFKSRPGDAGVRRVALSDKTALVEESGLKFSHKAHSGKVRRPSEPQKFQVMACADCHQPDSGGLRFKPVTMKEHCFDCHREEFDFNPPVDEHRLAHGSERAVVDMLEHYYLKKALREDTGRGGRVPVQQALVDAAARAGNTAAALTGDIGCGLCHETEPAGSGAGIPWKIRPLAITERWLPQARFAHDKHRAAKCTQCHELNRSRDSADVAIPDLQKCRECHGGEQGGNHKVASPCAACHAFHDAPRAQLTGK